jgi:fructan beta-fructosidase
MTIPRALSLVRSPEGTVLLRQQPVREFGDLASREVSPEPESTRPTYHQGGSVRTWRTDDTRAYHVEAVSSEPSTFRLILRCGTAGDVRVERTPTELRVDRSDCDMGPFNTIVDTNKAVPLTTTHGSVHLIVDRSILEIFADDGVVVTTDLLFPADALSAITCESQPASSAVSCRIFALDRCILR